MHFVYILYNYITDKFYIGETENLRRRINEHKDGQNIATKHKYSGWQFIYAEIYKSKKDAIVREKKLKAYGSGLVELKKRLKFSVEE